MNPTTTQATNPAYQKVADQLISLIETTGTLPWSKPWKNGSPFSANGCPTNINTKREYTGGNIFILAMAQMAGNYPTAFWGTFNQFKSLGAFVKKGAKGTPILKPNFKQVSAEPAEESDDSNTEMALAGFSVYYVFNVAQTTMKVEAPKVPETPVKVDPIAAAEVIIAAYKGCPPVNHGGNRAYYSPSDDRIQLPKKEDFVNMEHYYATGFHEMVHSTGHGSRLNREGVATHAGIFGSHEEYSFEELIAEMGACMLSSEAGILTTKVQENAVAYLQNWLSALKSNPSWLIKAAQKATQAAKFIRGI